LLGAEVGFSGGDLEEVARLKVRKGVWFIKQYLGEGDWTFHGREYIAS